MMKYKVVLVPFPFDDLSSSKVRPAICLTEAIGQYRHIILAFITSKVPGYLLDTDMLIAQNDDDFATSGLRVSSVLRLHKMMTAKSNFIRRELGQLSHEQQVIIEKKLKALFSLT